MTEQEWDTCEDSRDMLDALTALGYPASVIRGVAVRILATFTPPASESLGGSASYAHCEAERDDYLRLAGEAFDAENALRHPDCPDPARHFRPATVSYTLAGHGYAAAYADLVREEVGNPFRPTTPDPAWLTSDVVMLARGIRAEQAFDRMPVLADALMDAGADDEAVLRHCRQNKPHHDGCWVLNLLLGPAAEPSEGGP